MFLQQIQLQGAQQIYTTPKKLEEQSFDIRFFNLVRILDILGVAM